VALALGCVGIGFTFLPHVIIPDKRHGVHCRQQTQAFLDSALRMRRRSNKVFGLFGFVLLQIWPALFQTPKATPAL
jgi:hypothetical protein